MTLWIWSQIELASLQSGEKRNSPWGNMSKYVKLSRRAAGAWGSQRAQEVYLMRSPVLLSPVQPCLTRVKTCCLIHSCQGKGRRRCGETEEVWKDRGGKGRRMQVDDWQWKWKGKTENICFDFLLYGFENLGSLWWKCSDFGTTPGLAKGGEGGIHLLWGATKPKSNHWNHKSCNLKEMKMSTWRTKNKKNCMLRP